MDKLGYLRKVFAHTKGKSFENYIINQIWAKVEDFGLYPITQKYVKRSDNKYALLDLYFPQISFAVEADELPYHDNIIEKDKMRMEDIFSAIPEIEIERVREEDYYSVKKQIQKIVNKIQAQVKQKGPFSWEENWFEFEYENKISQVKNTRKLLVSDNIGFQRVQVTNDIFGFNYSEGYLQYGKSFFEVSDNEYIWFPHLTPNKDWENTISDDWNEIYEKYIGAKKEYKYDPYDHHNKNKLRYTFAKYKDALGQVAYRFIGVFKFLKKENDVFTFLKDSDEIRIKKWL
ncbi:hypothetical protein FACS189476_02650 [Spirochaetia bacterium]|nr:hypothetical protein FACS189476_02650 [Spirochaetia bacterium]